MFSFVLVGPFADLLLAAETGFFATREARDFISAELDLLDENVSHA